MDEKCPNWGRRRFQSPLGEVVKETLLGYFNHRLLGVVSIPSRGSGKGDFGLSVTTVFTGIMFQSPLGEVVKETTSWQRSS